MLTPCAYNRLLNKLTNIQKLKAFYDMQHDMPLEQVIILTRQPASQSARPASQPVGNNVNSDDNNNNNIRITTKIIIIINNNNIANKNR